MHFSASNKKLECISVFLDFTKKMKHQTLIDYDGCKIADISPKNEYSLS